MRLAQFINNQTASYTMRRIIYSLALLMFALAMGGCETTTPTIPLSEAAGASIDHVSIAEAVPIEPTRFNNYGILQVTHWNAFFSGKTFLTKGSGPLSDAILASGEWEVNRQYAMFVKAANIDLPQMVHDEFETQARKDPYFGPRLAQNSKYRVELSIVRYGLVQTVHFSDNYKARISVRARLIGPDGKVVAEAGGHSCIRSTCFPVNKLSEILAKPELLRAQYVAATHIAIQELLKSL